MQVDKNLTFTNHVKTLCKNACRKISRMAHIAIHMSESKKKILLRAFFESLFSYCPLIWMFCDRNLDHKINRLHERALRIAYNDYNASFEEFLEKDGSINIHQRNLRCLATEVFKIKNKLSPPFICDLVNELDELNVPHHTRSHYKLNPKMEI